MWWLNTDPPVDSVKARSVHKWVLQVKEDKSPWMDRVNVTSVKHQVVFSEGDMAAIPVDCISPEHSASEDSEICDELELDEQPFDARKFFYHALQNDLKLNWKKAQDAAGTLDCQYHAYVSDKRNGVIVTEETARAFLLSTTYYRDKL